MGVIREKEESPYSVAVLAVKLAGAAERSLMHSLWWEGRPGESSQGRDKAGLGESSPVNVPPGSQKSLSGLWSGHHFRLRADNNFSLWNFIVLVQETLKSVLSFQPNKGSDCWSLSCAWYLDLVPQHMTTVPYRGDRDTLDWTLEILIWSTQYRLISPHSK